MCDVGKLLFLPDLPRKVDEQIKCVREFLSVSSLAVLKKENLAVSFRSYTDCLSQSNIVNANAMVQIAINRKQTILKLENSTEKGDANW